MGMVIRGVDTDDIVHMEIEKARGRQPLSCRVRMVDGTGRTLQGDEASELIDYLDSHPNNRIRRDHVLPRYDDARISMRS